MSDLLQRLNERRLEVGLHMLESGRPGVELVDAVLARLRREGITTLRPRRRAKTQVAAAAAALLLALLLGTAVGVWRNRGLHAPASIAGAAGEVAAATVRTAEEARALPPPTTAVRAVSPDRAMLHALKNAKLSALVRLELVGEDRAGARPAPPGSELPSGELALLAGQRELRTLVVQDLRIAPADLAEVARLGSVRELHLHNVDLCDEHLAALAGMSHLEGLYLLDLGTLTDAGVRSLLTLAGLRELQLAGFGAVTSEGYRGLAALTRLRSLDLSLLPDLWSREAGRERQGIGRSAGLQLAGEVDASVLSALAALRDLRCLRLIYRPAITDRALASLAAVGALEELDLSGCLVSDMGLTRLPSSLRRLGLAGCRRIRGALPAQLSQLEEIVLSSNPNVGDAEVAALVALPALRSLDLRFCPSVTASGASCLARALHLQELLLCGSRWVDDALLVQLAQLPELHSLAFAGLPNDAERGRVSAAGIRALGALPRLERLRLAHNQELPVAALRALRHEPLVLLDLSSGDLRFDAETPDLDAVRALWPHARLVDRDAPRR